MKIKHFSFIYAISFLALTLSMVGCMNSPLDSCFSQLPDISTAYNPSIKENDSAIDSSCFFKKLWVVENWDGGAYYFPFSFFITKINDGYIEGRLETYTVAQPDFYFHGYNQQKSSGSFSGIIKGVIANCDFNDIRGNRGNVEFVFIDNNSIKATINYAEIGDRYENISINGVYFFRPYNLIDHNKDIDAYKTQSVLAETKLWGNVKLVTVEFAGNKPNPSAFLTDEYENILYCFAAPFKVGSEVIIAEIIDINEDGLEDIFLRTWFPEDPNIEQIDWIFYQMNDGLFNSNILESQNKFEDSYR